MLTNTVLFLILIYYSNGEIPNIQVPPATVDVFSPAGLRVSIPDMEKKFYSNDIGIKLFSFHGNVNKKIGLECGTFCRDIIEPEKGRWIFYDPAARLDIGDILYYWTYIDFYDGKNKLGYKKTNQKYVVTAYNNINVTTASSNLPLTTTTRTDKSTYFPNSESKNNN